MRDFLGDGRSYPMTQRLDSGKLGELVLERLGHGKLATAAAALPQMSAEPLVRSHGVDVLACAR
jgi:hypothetical protein